MDLNGLTTSSLVHCAPVDPRLPSPQPIKGPTQPACLSVVDLGFPAGVLNYSIQAIFSHGNWGHLILLLQKVCLPLTLANHKWLTGLSHLLSAGHGYLGLTCCQPHLPRDGVCAVTLMA